MCRAAKLYIQFSFLSPFFIIRDVCLSVCLFFSPSILLDGFFRGWFRSIPNITALRIGYLKFPVLFDFIDILSGSRDLVDR